MGIIVVKDIKKKLDLPNYEGRGVLHPDIVHRPRDKYPFWLFYTPFPPRQAESPCLAKSKDGINFTTEGIDNPIFVACGPPYEADHIADPDIVEVGGELIMFYSASSRNPPFSIDSKILEARSKDGIEWERRGPVLVGVEPTAVYERGNKILRLWYRDYGKNKNNIMHIQRIDGIWEPPKEIRHILPGTIEAWPTHPDVFKRSSKEYYMWILLKQLPKTEYNYILQRYFSDDGTNWQKLVFEEGLTNTTAPYRASSVIVDGVEFIYKSKIDLTKKNPTDPGPQRRDFIEVNILEDQSCLDHRD